MVEYVSFSITPLNIKVSETKMPGMETYPQNYNVSTVC